LFINTCLQIVQIGPLSLKLLTNFIIAARWHPAISEKIALPLAYLYLAQMMSNGYVRIEASPTAPFLVFIGVMPWIGIWIGAHVLVIIGSSFHPLKSNFQFW